MLPGETQGSREGQTETMVVSASSPVSSQATVELFNFERLIVYPVPRTASPCYPSIPNLSSSPLRSPFILHLTTSTSIRTTTIHHHPPPSTPIHHLADTYALSSPSLIKNSPPYTTLVRLAPRFTSSASGGSVDAASEVGEEGPASGGAVSGARGGATSVIAAVLLFLCRVGIERLVSRSGRVRVTVEGG